MTSSLENSIDNRILWTKSRKELSSEDFFMTRCDKPSFNLEVLLQRYMQRLQDIVTGRWLRCYNVPHYRWKTKKKRKTVSILKKDSFCWILLRIKTAFCVIRHGKDFYPTITVTVWTINTDSLNGYTRAFKGNYFLSLNLFHRIQYEFLNLYKKLSNQMKDIHKSYQWFYFIFSKMYIKIVPSAYREQ